MHLLTKLRAILTLGVVSGIFWWLAFALGRAGYELIEYGRFGLAFGGRMQLTIALIGFLGDVVSGGLLGSVLFPMAVCSILGSVTALAIGGTAKRGELPPGT